MGSCGGLVCWLPTCPRSPCIALQIVRRYLEKPTPAAGAAAGASRFNQKELLREALIDYRGPPKTIKTVSYYQALHYERMLPPGTFAGKIVLVGRLLEAIPEPQRLSGDTFLTPFSWVAGSPSAGVEIQANIIDNVLEGRFISELGGLGQWILLLSATLAASLLVARLEPVAALIATGALAVLTMATAYLVLAQMNLWLPILSTVMSFALVYGGHLLIRTLAAEHERRRLLEETNRDLEAKIAERTRELSTANRKLHQRHQEIEAAYQELSRAQEQLVHSEKMASLGLLVAGVAHELNNPISYVYSDLEFAQDYVERLAGLIGIHETAGPSNHSTHPHHDGQTKETTKVDATLQTLRELIASCREGAERMKKIVLDLRVFSRTDDVGLVLADLHEGIDSTLSLLAKEYRDRIVVHREYGYLPLVECYPGQLNQVFMNLLQNAAQAIRKPPGDVWIRTELDGDWARIAIRDNGAGIAENDLTRVFDPFFTTKPVGSGTGLGLSISYGIIEKHGGKIRVTSQVGEGTEFTVELPVRSMRKAA